MSQHTNHRNIPSLIKCKGTLLHFAFVLFYWYTLEIVLPFVQNASLLNDSIISHCVNFHNSSFDGHWSCCQYLALTNCVALNNLAHHFLMSLVYLKDELLSGSKMCVLVTWMWLKCLPEVTPVFTTGTVYISSLPTGKMKSGLFWCFFMLGLKLYFIHLKAKFVLSMSCPVLYLFFY